MHYLKELGLFNTGPVQNFKLNAEFTEEGKPKPIVLVGANGSGKTIAISTIVDALYEFACAAGFNDVLPLQGASRKYWRVSGGSINYFGAPTSVSWITMGEAKESSTPWTYFDKSTEFSAEEWSASVGNSIPYPGKGVENKTPNISNQTEPAKQLFKNSAYCYFPSNRNETPFWVNKPYKPEKSGDGAHLFNLELGKPIECTQSMRDNAVWLLDVILDDLAEGDARRRTAQYEWHQIHPQGMQPNAEQAVQLANKMAPNESLVVYSNTNKLLSEVLGYSAKLSVNGRTSHKRLQYSKVNDGKQLHVSHLSNGQSTLFNIFLTILKYSDDASKSKPLDQIEGVVVIDEADAGLHIRYQHDVLPKLMRLMPKVQFILATHSPLLLLGLEKEYGADGVQIIELPTGRQCLAEDFSEFQAAYDALEETRKFRAEFKQAVSIQTEKPWLLVEGPSDEILLQAAWLKLRKGSEFPFSVRGKRGKALNQTVLKDIADGHLSTSIPTLALWDFDDAFADWLGLVGVSAKAQKNAKYSEISDRTESDGLVCQLKTGKPTYGALLPVPSFRVRHANKKAGRQKLLSIELLFEDEILKQHDALTEIEIDEGVFLSALKANSDEKIPLSEKLATQDAKAFEHFEPLLKMLEEFLLPNKGEPT